MIDVSKLLADYAANKLPDSKIRDQLIYVDGFGCPETLGKRPAQLPEETPAPEVPFDAETGEILEPEVSELRDVD